MIHRQAGIVDCITLQNKRTFFTTLQNRVHHPRYTLCNMIHISIIPQSQISRKTCLHINLSGLFDKRRNKRVDTREHKLRAMCTRTSWHVYSLCISYILMWLNKLCITINTKTGNTTTKTNIKSLQIADTANQKHCKDINKFTTLIYKRKGLFPDDTLIHA
jgi:hypothetical protein